MAGLALPLLSLVHRAIPPCTGAARSSVALVAYAPRALVSRLAWAPHYPRRRSCRSCAPRFRLVWAPRCPLRCASRADPALVCMGALVLHGLHLLALLLLVDGPYRGGSFKANQGHVHAVHPEGLGAHGAPRLGPSPPPPPPRPRPGLHHPRPTDRCTAAPAVRQCRRTRTTRTAASSFSTY